MLNEPLRKPSVPEWYHATSTSPRRPPLGREPWTTMGIAQPPTLLSSDCGASHAVPLLSERAKSIRHSSATVAEKLISKRVAETKTQLPFALPSSPLAA